jgi:hypothetical protein
MTLDLFVFTFKLHFSFPCLNGVRQGVHLLSFLFALYLNDLDTFLTSKNAQGVKSISEEFENDLQIDVKLFTILYYYTGLKLHCTFYPLYYT